MRPRLAPGPEPSTRHVYAGCHRARETADHLRRPALGSLAVAISAQRPGAGLIHHSDRGVHASADTASRCNPPGLRACLSRKDDCYDNAPMESVHTLKTELGATPFNPALNHVEAIIGSLGAEAGLRYRTAVHAIGRGLPASQSWMVALQIDDQPRAE